MISTLRTYYPNLKRLNKKLLFQSAYVLDTAIRILFITCVPVIMYFRQDKQNKEKPQNPGELETGGQGGGTAPPPFVEN